MCFLSVKFIKMSIGVEGKGYERKGERANRMKVWEILYNRGALV